MNLLALLLIIQSLWFSIPADQMPPPYSISEARLYAAALDPLYVENGILDKRRGYTIEEYDPEAKSWKKFPPFYLFRKAPEGYLEGLIETFAPKFRPPPGWRAGTSRAYAEIVFNPQWHSERFAWYGSPEWTATTAHELAHVYQTAKGYSIPGKTEEAAALITLEILASSDHPYSRVALIGKIREMLISSVLYFSSDPRTLLDTIQLQGNERIHYLRLIDQCEKSRHMCDLRAGSYYKTPLLKVLYDTDGVITNASTVSGVIDIGDTKAAFEEIFGYTLPEPRRNDYDDLR